MKLNRKQIIKIQKNRDPYLLMDCATKIVPGKSVEGYKVLKKSMNFLVQKYEIKKLKII